LLCESILDTVVLTQAFSNPALGIWLKIALAAYVVWASRKFYADPMGYFRRLARNAGTELPELPQVGQLVRWLACFCIWGGCFIIASAIIAQILDIHGWGYAILLVLLAAIAAYFLLPPTGGAVQSQSNEDRDAGH
jgi:hypothetical protein